MSYILDALRKAEHDRRSKQTPNLDIPLPAQARQTKAGHRIIVPALIIVIFALLLYIFLPAEKEDKLSSVTTPVNEYSAPPPPISPPSLDKPQQTESTIADLMKKRTLAPLPQKKSELTFHRKKKTQDSARAPGSKNKTTILKTNKPVGTRTPLTKRVVQGKKTTDLYPQGQKTKPANTERHSQLEKKNNNDIPWLNDLSPDFKRNLPNLNINVFVYDENPKARFVIVNMRKYKPGQTITDDIVVEEITPHGMILTSDGNRFRIPRP